jgi:predicted transcriptional regulator
MGSDDQVEGLLGELEQAVMQVVWDRGTVSVRQVHEALQPERALAYTTVMTVMSRLTDKGVLERQKQGRAFVYRAAQRNRRGFLRRQARLQIHALLARYGDLAVAEFVDELSAGDAERLAALEALLAEHRAEGGADER